MKHLHNLVKIIIFNKISEKCFNNISFSIAENVVFQMLLTLELWLCWIGLLGFVIQQHLVLHMFLSCVILLY